VIPPWRESRRNCSAALRENKAAVIFAPEAEKLSVTEIKELLEILTEGGPILTEEIFY
jgi:hypothetical protein